MGQRIGELDPPSEIAKSAIKGWKMRLDEGWDVAKAYSGFDLLDTDAGDFLLAFDSAQSRDEHEWQIHNLNPSDYPGAQLPTERRVSFEHEDKYYLVLEAAYELTDKTDETLYRGVVVNPKSPEPRAETYVAKPTRDSVSDQLAG